LDTRRLGKTGFQVGVLGLGTEYLLSQPGSTVASVIRSAVDAGVNFVDVLFSETTYLEHLRVGLDGLRDKVRIAAHYGSGMVRDQPANIRDLQQCEHYLDEVRRGLDSDVLDVAFVHMVDTDAEYEEWFLPAIDALRRRQQKGHVRFVGMSGHHASVAQRAVEEGAIDVLMFPLNLASHHAPGREALLQACDRHDVGVVAMKPYAGGKLLQENSDVFLHWVQAGGLSMDITKTGAVSPAQCLAYLIDQPSVATIVPGVKNLPEMAEAIAALNASEKERDYRDIVRAVRTYPSGACVYCNHCLPCPAGIDIGTVIRMADEARHRMTPALRHSYRTLSADAADCLACEDCMPRCPFQVNVVARMEEAAAVFS